MRLPVGWVGLDATIPASIITNTATRFPDLTATLDELRASSLGFVGYDPSSTGPFTPNVTIATTGDPIPVASLLDALAGQTAAQIAKTETISAVRHVPATLSAGPAAELSYTLTVKGSGQQIAVDSWFVSTAGHTFLLTFSVPIASMDALRPDIQAAAESLKGG